LIARFSAFVLCAQVDPELRHFQRDAFAGEALRVEFFGDDARSAERPENSVLLARYFVESGIQSFARLTGVRHAVEPTTQCAGLKESTSAFS